MADIDLPDPEEVKITNPKQLEERSFQTLYTLTLFAVAYASVHKVWIPLFLKFTEVIQSSYQRIDIWILPGALFAAHLWRTRQLNPLGSFLCGFLIVHGGLELVFISLGKYFGWLQFSHLLSSVPVALLCIGWLTMAKTRNPRPRLAWLGVLCALLFSAGVDSKRDEALPSLAAPEENLNPLKKSVSDSVDTSPAPSQCGAQAFFIKPADMRNVPASAEVRLEDCGFSPYAQRSADISQLLVKNATPNSANIHILAFRSDGRKRGFNRILRRNESFQLNQTRFKPATDEVILVYSDTNPTAGLSAIVPNNVRSNMKISRSPIGIEFVGEKP